VPSQQCQLDDTSEWLDLKAITRYACLSERTVREWIHQPQNPLPAVQVNGGKILIRRTLFDRWLEAHPFLPNRVIDLGRIVDDVMIDLRKAS
jgi:excisionase family DNA binding protein